MDPLLGLTSANPANTSPITDGSNSPPIINGSNTPPIIGNPSTPTIYIFAKIHHQEEMDPLLKMDSDKLYNLAKKRIGDFVLIVVKVSEREREIFHKKGRFD